MTRFDQPAVHGGEDPLSPEQRTQWVIVAALVVILIGALLVGSRCDRQDGDMGGARADRVAEEVERYVSP